MTKLFSLSSLKELKAIEVKEALKTESSFDHWFDGICENQPYSIHVSAHAARHGFNYSIKLVDMDNETSVYVEEAHGHNVGEMKEAAADMMRQANENIDLLLSKSDLGENNKRPSISKVFDTYGITKVKEGKYTVFFSFRNKEITRVAGGLRAILERSRLIRDALLDGRDDDDQPCDAFKDFISMAVGGSFKLVFPGASKETVLDCSKISASHVEWLDSEGNSKKTKFNKGWSQVRIIADTPAEQSDKGDDVTKFIFEVASAMDKTRGRGCWWLDKFVCDTLRKAQEKGLVHRPSVTQVEWTEKGVAAYREASI